MSITQRFVSATVIAMMPLLETRALGQAVLYVDDSATETVHDGSNWCRGFVDLQSGLAAASALAAGGATVDLHVAEGTHHPAPPDGDRSATFQLVNGVTIKGGYAGCGAADPNARDSASYPTILSGDLNGDDGNDCCWSHGSTGCSDAACQQAVCDVYDFCCDESWDTLCANRADVLCGGLCAASDISDNSLHVVTGSGTDATAVLDGFTITRGYANGAAPNNRGGGMINAGGSPTVMNVRFEANAASGTGSGSEASGGGVYNEANSAAFVNCEFAENVTAAVRGLGGAVSIKSANPSFVDCTFERNRASGQEGIGGAASITDQANPSFERCVFRKNFAAVSGGAIFCQNATVPTFHDCLFDDNNAISHGGAMFNIAQCDPTIERCIFKNNVARLASGGAIGDHIECNPLVIESQFLNNHAASGGAVYDERGFGEYRGCLFEGNTTDTYASGAWAAGGAFFGHSSQAVFLNSRFRGNVSHKEGGAVLDFRGSLQYENCVFEGNTASWRGGAIFNTGSTAMIDRCVFANNSADTYGGAIDSSSSGDGPGFLTIHDSLLINNHADIGGAIHTGTSPGNVSGCVFVANSALNGAGLYHNNSQLLNLTNSTLVQNVASGATGGFRVYNGTNTFVRTSILFGNLDASGASEAAQVAYVTTPPTIQYCLVQGWTGVLGGVGNSGDDPMFVDADGADNIPGTPDDNLRLSPDSPAINSADPEYVPPPGETDMDGHARRLCGRVDIGAYEFGIGDHDCDRDVDLFDFASWTNCFTGPNNGPLDAGCEALDFDGDVDVDLADFGGMQTALGIP